MGAGEDIQGRARPGKSARAVVRSRFHAPPVEFAGCFTSFYHLSLEFEGVGTGGEAEPVVADLLQPEWANMRFFCGSLPRAALGGVLLEGARFVATGPSSRPCRFELGAARMWGIGLLPVGWARFIAADAYALANTVLDGSRHAAFARFDAMSEALCDPALDEAAQLAVIVEHLAQAMRPHRDEPKIARVHTALVDTECHTVCDLADRAGMSIRTLERICRRYFGFTPKLLMRRQRFMRSLTSFMLERSRGSDLHWTDAMDEAYHDQAQFTREFAEFMTMLPTEYAALEHPILASFIEARARVWGSAAQTLDPPVRS
ncbi:MAG: helix-turn-helix domain-containing protein [Erythrobacter sp.]|jgi:AraC-like DNA-binding protein|nr:helix-turn-helix domain-containing protein [Erythrobacter sp.]